jgi:hypothetical protein
MNGIDKNALIPRENIHEKFGRSERWWPFLTETVAQIEAAVHH